jgi:hypothetical protein
MGLMPHLFFVRLGVVCQKSRLMLGERFCVKRLPQIPRLWLGRISEVPSTLQQPDMNCASRPPSSQGFVLSRCWSATPTWSHFCGVRGKTS